MLQVIYTSVATVPFSIADLRTLLTASRLRNSSAEVTGHLLFDGLHFLQALEGPEAAVKSTLDRIAADSRHRDVNVLRMDPVTGRLFGEWSMGFEDSSKASQARRGYKSLTSETFVTANLSADEAAALLHDSLRTAGSTS